MKIHFFHIWLFLTKKCAPVVDEQGFEPLFYQRASLRYEKGYPHPLRDGSKFMGTSAGFLGRGPGLFHVEKKGGDDFFRWGVDFFYQIKRGRNFFTEKIEGLILFLTKI